MIYSKELLGFSIETTLLITGNKLKVLILRDLFTDTKRFNELKKLLTDVTQKLLTQELRELECDELLIEKFIVLFR